MRMPTIQKYNTYTPKIIRKRAMFGKDFFLTGALSSFIVLFVPISIHNHGQY